MPATAHRLVTLHDPSDQPIFDTAVVVTDRVVLDRQLQETIAQFEVANGGVNSVPTQGLKWRATSCRNLRPSVSSR
ncbi:hypothetical protein MesoLjLb_38690 [Mesorhizobium sp. L-8-3]|nr:hypothetical protein MesoLjLb_38690 [Mesorhizobium sp. L-8-3]